jgi:sporadic carbohydrate cluster protein (TIGR04323 family)
MPVLTTYTMPRPFHGFNIPIAIQSAYLKDYAQRSGFTFSLPITELTTSKSYALLRKILANNEETTLNLGVVSAFAFPVRNLQMMNDIFLPYISSDAIVHFPLESLTLNFKELLSWSELHISIQEHIPSFNEILTRYGSEPLLT